MVFVGWKCRGSAPLQRLGDAARFKRNPAAVHERSVQCRSVGESLALVRWIDSHGPRHIASAIKARQHRYISAGAQIVLHRGQRRIK
jgi:hypothetical protein